MTIGECLYNALSTGTYASTRVYPLFVPATTTAYPLITYSVEKSRLEGNKDGNELRVVCSIIGLAKSYDSCHLMMDDCWDKLVAYIPTFATNGFHDLKYVSEADAYLPQVAPDCCAVTLTIELTEYQ